MKFKNLETNTIIEVEKDNKERIEKFLGYPDKFEVIEEPKEELSKEEPKLEEPKEVKSSKRIRKL